MSAYNQSLSKIVNWMNLIWSDDALSPHARLIACCLRSFMNDNNDLAFPSLSTLSKRTKLSRPSVIKFINELSDEGWIRSIKLSDKKTSNRYQASFPERYKAAFKAADKAFNEELEQHKVVKDVYHPSKGDLLGVVKDVYPNKQSNKQTNKQSKPTHREPPPEAHPVFQNPPKPKVQKNFVAEDWRPKQAITDQLLASYSHEGLSLEYIELKRNEFVEWWNNCTHHSSTPDTSYRNFVQRGWVKFDRANYLRLKAAESQLERQNVYLDNAKARTDKDFDPLNALSDAFDKVVRTKTRDITTTQAICDRSWA